jgi:hypothetical protein
MLTSTGNDPYVNNYATAAQQDKGDKIAFPVKAGYTYYLSWRHVSGPELNKNIYSFYENHYIMSNSLINKLTFSCGNVFAESKEIILDIDF